MRPIIFQKYARFEQDYCSTEEASSKVNIQALLEKSYKHAFNLADNLSVVIYKYMETGNGMTPQEALTATATVANLLQAGNTSVDLIMATEGSTYIGGYTGHRQYSLIDCFKSVWVQKEGNKIAGIKSIRSMTGCGLKEAKYFYEEVIADIGAERLKECDIFYDKADSMTPLENK